MSAVKTHIVNIRTNGLLNPIGISTNSPIFSFEVETKYNNSSLEYYCISVEETLSGQVLWDSGMLYTPLSNNIIYGGSELADNTAYTVKVTASVSGEVLRKSAHFRTGYIEKTVEISPKILAAENISSPLLRHTFFTGKVISHATLYISGNCLIRPYINGVAITNNFIIGTKGVAKALDVTALLTSDNNTLGVWLMRDQSDYKGEAPYIQCGLHFCTVDGKGVTIDLSSDWVYKQSPVTLTEVGEIYDNRINIAKWCDSYSSIAEWDMCSIEPSDNVYLAECRNPFPLASIKSRRTETIEDDLTIYDFGAITLSRLKIKIMGEPGARLIISYAKTEDELDFSACQDVYIIKGHEIEVYEPFFSVHCFRFAKLYIDGVAQLISAEAVALGTEAMSTTTFLCRCISQYKSFMEIMRNNADYSVIPTSYRTLEGMLLATNKKLLECHFFGLEQFGVKSLSNEILASSFLKICNIDFDPEQCCISINTALPNDADSLKLETRNAFGKFGVYYRKISNKIYTDYVIPLGFRAEIKAPNGKDFSLSGGKYMYEEI